MARLMPHFAGTVSEVFVSRLRLVRRHVFLTV